MRGTPGAPSFVGTRLKEAREARSLTMVALADLLGVSKQAVSQYEKDLQSPAPAVMERICATLNLPAHYFCREVQRRDLGAVFFRSYSTATKTARVRAIRRFEWLEEIVSYAQSYVKFPDVHFPNFDVPSDPALLRMDAVENLAMQTRRHWGLKDGPISNIVWLLERNGAIVVRQVLDSEDLDAFSNWNQKTGRPLFVLSADKASAVRSRMDAAHELGHMVLHRAVTPTMMQRKEVFKLVEEQAKHFASAFLLPPASFSTELAAPTLGAMRAMKSKWKVSIGAMVVRATELGLVSEGEARRLWIGINRHGWKLREPLDDVLEVETPQFLTRAVDLIFKSGIISRESFAHHLTLTDSDVEGVLGMPLGTLRMQQDDTPLVLKMPERAATGTDGLPTPDRPSVRFRPRCDRE